MSLLQPAPETFDLFDDIILLSEGQIVYEGPRESVLEFFESCGFKCPERKGTADFLQEVTSRKDQKQYWADASKPYKFVPATGFVECFNRFHVGEDLQNKLSVPFDKKKSHGAALVFTKRSAPLKRLLEASFKKEWLLIKRNSFIYISRIIQLAAMALITTTLFPRTKMKTRNEADGEVYIGAILFGLTVNLVYCFVEQGFVIMRLPVFYKQRNLLFYPTWVFTFPHCMMKTLISIIESALWVILTYYFIGFAPEARRFFKQILLLFLVREMGAGLFRLVAGLTRSNTFSNISGNIILLFLIALSGYVVPKALLPKWWIWGYWLSPVKYSFTALAINEMLSPRWMDKLATDGRRLGEAILENINVVTDESWYWKSAAVLLGYAVLFNVLFTFSLAYLDPPGKPNPAISVETAVDMKAKRSISMDKGNKVVKSRSDCTTNGILDWHSLNPYKKEAKNTTFRRGMALPFTPLAMSFKDVNYYVNMPLAVKEQEVTKEKLQLLRGVTGAFRPGILTALMGESGSGKTTLMDVLAGRKTSGYIEGDIRIAGHPKKQSTFARISGYCEQFDVHSPHLTVMESLIFSALLRLAKNLNEEEKYRFMSEVMELVELDNLKNALVGIPGITGLSTEQRKRLTIAIELVANPSIIFMDEPTSGLDARAAAIVMRSVRNIVDTGRTVVCTIHQPSIDIFQSFDELVLLKRGGQVIYSGPLGQSQKLIEYFEAIPGVEKIEEKRNPAVWMLEASSTATEARLGVDFAEIYNSSFMNKCNLELVREISEPLLGTCDLCFPTKYPQSSLDQFKICLWKYRSIYWRNPEYNLSRFGLALIIAFLLGSFFWKIGLRRDNSTDLISIIGIMYLGLLFIGQGNRSTVQPFIASERLVFYREYAAGMYSAFPYALSQVIVEISFVFFQALCYTLIVYSMMSFQWTTTKFTWFFIIIFLSFLGFTYLGMLLMAISPNLQVAGILSSSIFLLFHLFSGFFIPRPGLPKWWIWYYWMCPTSWTLYGLIITQYGDMHDLIKVSGQPDQQIRDFVFSHFGYKDEYKEIMIIVLLGFVILFALLYSFCIRSLNFQRR